MGGFGDDLGDLGEPGADETGMMSGEEGSEGLDNMSGGQLLESVAKNRRLLGIDDRLKKKINNYTNMLSKKNPLNERVGIMDKAFIINENINQTLKEIDSQKTEVLVEE
jgi:hypothetical protein